MDKYRIWIEYEDAFEIEAEVMADAVVDRDYPFETQICDIEELD